MNAHPHADSHGIAAQHDSGAPADVAEREPQASIASQFVSLGRKPDHASPPPIACTLTAGSLRGRIVDWQRLLAHVDSRERLDRGVRAVFGPTVPLGELMRLTAAEHDCCQFLAFAITVDTRGIALEVTAETDALPIVESLFGTP